MKFCNRRNFVLDTSYFFAYGLTIIYGTTSRNILLGKKGIFNGSRNPLVGNYINLQMIKTKMLTQFGVPSVHRSISYKMYWLREVYKKVIINSDLHTEKKAIQFWYFSPNNVGNISIEHLRISAYPPQLLKSDTSKCPLDPSPL